MIQKFPRKVKGASGLEGKEPITFSFAQRTPPIPSIVSATRRKVQSRVVPEFDVGGLILLCFAPASRAQIRCDLPVVTWYSRFHALHRVWRFS